MARINEQVLQNITSATTSATYKYRKRKGHDIIAYSIVAGSLTDGLASGGGAITGTYVLESAVPGTSAWITVPDGTFTDTETSGTFVPGGDMDLRWNCTAYTTATVVRIG